MSTWELLTVFPKIASHVLYDSFQNRISDMNFPSWKLSPRADSLLQKASVELAKVGTVPVEEFLVASAGWSIPNILQMESWMGGRLARLTNCSSTLIGWARYSWVQSQPCHRVMHRPKVTIVQVNSWSGSQPPFFFIIFSFRAISINKTGLTYCLV